MNIREFYRRYFDKGPYAEVRGLCKEVPFDLHVPQSWGSTDPLFASLIESVKPRSIIELGTWKGTSAIHMARHAIRHHPDVSILCVDTWLASNPALWKVKRFRENVLTWKLEDSQYAQFLWNVLHSGFENQIFPFRNTTGVALRLLRERRVRVDFIYIDAGHLEHEVASDLQNAWPLLNRGGIIAGDDFSARFPGVPRAVRAFSKNTSARLVTDRQKWWFHKR
jgi:predicted O-methyltransferase YrrM